MAEHAINENRILLARQAELENKIRHSEEVNSDQDKADKQEEEAIKNQMDFDLAKVSIKRNQIESQRKSFQNDAAPVKQHVAQQVSPVEQHIHVQKIEP